MTAAWLALDTAADQASAAAGIPPRASASVAVSGARRHAAEIVAMSDTVLRRAGVALADLAGIVVADGPGSFTGLRIGWAAARGLAHERDLPLRAIPALLAAAAGAAGREGQGVVAACFDALRGQVYGAVYRFDGTDVATLVAPAVLTVQELADRAGTAPRVVVGDGAVRYAAAVRSWTGRDPLEPGALPAGAESLLALVDRAGVGRLVGANDEPEYGRPAEAQAQWEARHGRPLPDPSGRPR